MTYEPFSDNALTPKGEKGNSMKKTILILMALVMIVGCFSLTGCREANRVDYNVSKDADNFNVMRRLAVINTVDGSPVFEMVGRFAINADTEDNQLEVVVETSQGVYKKHIIGLNQATTMYVVEDISGADVSKWKYEINYLPKMIQPFDIVHKE